MHTSAVLLGFLCAFLIGTANFTAGLVSKKDPSPTIAFVGQVTTVPIMAIVLALMPPDSVPLTDVLWGLGAGVIQIVGLRLLYRALSIGKMGLLAATNATMAAIVPAVWALLTGESLEAIGVAGALLALIAVP